MTTSFVSFAAQTKQQSTQLIGLRDSLNDLQRQIATQKKHDTISGFGTDAAEVQRLRTDSDDISAYIDTIDRTRLRGRIMTESLTEITRIAREVAESFTLQTQNGEVDIEAIRTVAQQNLIYLQDLINTKHGDAFVFAGNDSTSAPFDNEILLNNNMQNEITDWLAAGQTPAQLITDVNGFSGNNLGYSTALGASGDVFAKIDVNVEVNYTVKADVSSLQDIVRFVALAANLQYPDPAVDIATDSEFHQIADEIANGLTNAARDLDDENYNLANKVKLMENIQNRHIQDNETLKEIISSTEDADTTEVLVALQALQTQMQASFQATNVINRLSLVNFL